MNVNEEVKRRLAELMQKKDERASPVSGPVIVKHVQQVDVLLPRKLEGEVVSEDYVQIVDQETGAVQEVTRRCFVECPSCGQLVRTSGRKDWPVIRTLGCGCVACPTCLENRGGVKVCTECARLICAAHATTYTDSPDVVLCPECREHSELGIFGTIIVHFLRR